MTKKDASQIARIDKAVTQAGAPDGYDRILDQEVGRGTYANFVAEMEGKVVGYMMCYITSGSFGVGRCAWIAMFGVYPKLMGQGIGKALAEEIFDYFKGQGVTEVFTTVRWDSTDLLSFFKTLGFDRSDFINLRKALN
ncbi:MAG: GNAT family N-acetyltransferase [Deltaproteobacteria bacterium]|nr:GNAT family N-acetyltransferase [Deltaproteobacteria bacterium]